MSDSVLEAKNKFLESLLYTIVLLITFATVLFGTTKILETSEVIHIKCSDTMCAVKIIDDMCFARIAELDTSPFIKVKCDQNRKGSYNTTLPCNVKDNGDCVINCDKDNTIRFLASIALPVITVFLFLLSISYTVISLVLLNRFCSEKNKENDNKNEKNATNSAETPNTPNLTYIELEEVGKRDNV